MAPDIMFGLAEKMPEALDQNKPFLRLWRAKFTELTRACHRFQLRMRNTACVARRCPQRAPSFLAITLPAWQARRPAR
jgi:hypothetical protein